MTVEIAKSPKISHFLNLHDSSVGCHVNAASGKSVEIQECWTSQKEELFEVKTGVNFIF